MTNPAYGQESRIIVDAAVRIAYWDYIGRLPRARLLDEWSRYKEKAGGVNTWFFPPIATGDANPEVRMCPDVLFSLLSYEVNEEPLRLSVPVSRDPFWSLTLFHDNAEAFFFVDDQQVEDNSAELLILGPGQAWPSKESVRVVASPSNRGIAVVRTVVATPESLEALDRQRKRAKAVPAHPRLA